MAQNNKNRNFLILILILLIILSWYSFTKRIWRGVYLIKDCDKRPKHICWTNCPSDKTQDPTYGWFSAPCGTQDDCSNAIDYPMGNSGVGYNNKPYPEMPNCSVPPATIPIKDDPKPAQVPKCPDLWKNQ